MTRLVTASTEWHDTRLEYAYRVVDDLSHNAAIGKKTKAFLLEACEAIENADIAMENGE